MGQITMRISAGEDARFAPGALDGLVGSETQFNGQPAQILAARVLPDGWAEVTLETDALGDVLPAIKAAITWRADHFSFRTEEG